VKELGDAEEATLWPITESEYALWRRNHGAKIINSGGRYWEAKPWGFYHAIHWMARMRASEASAPSNLAWGFRTTLHDDDRGIANGSMPIHLLTDVENYDISVLSSKKRNKLRNCRKKVNLVQILKPDLLKQQGYQVYRSAQQRTGYGRKLTLDEFHNIVDGYFNLKNQLVLGGLVNGELGGYVLANALGDTAYINAVNLDSAALSTNIGTCLIYSLVQACRRSGCIRKVVYGQDTPEDRPLTLYKVEMGFPVVHVPSRVWLAPIFKTIVRHHRPYAYYRLTGNPV
jgi:hypothetical protein